MPKKDIAHHLRYETKRTDLPPDVIQTMGEAYAEIVRLEKRILDFQEGFEGGCYLCEPVGETNRELRKNEKRNIIADEILSSEPFMWLMIGSNHTRSQTEALREAWRAWMEAGGKSYGKQ